MEAGGSRAGLVTLHIVGPSKSWSGSRPWKKSKFTKVGSPDRSKAQGVGEVDVSLSVSSWGRKQKAPSAATAWFNLPRQGCHRASAHTEHGRGLALVLLMDCLQDGYEVLEGWAEGRLCLPAVLHEMIDLTGTFVRSWQPLPSFQQLGESQNCHLTLGDAYELKEFRGGALAGVTVRQQLIQGHPEGPDIGRIVELILFQALWGIPRGRGSLRPRGAALRVWGSDQAEALT